MIRRAAANISSRRLASTPSVNRCLRVRELSSLLHRRLLASPSSTHYSSTGISRHFNGTGGTLHIKYPLGYFSSIPHREEDDELDEDGGDDVSYSDSDISTNYTIEQFTSLKVERRKDHARKQLLAEARKERARRKILAEEWMRLFATSDELFNATLREFNITKEWGGSNSNNEDSVLNEYRQFYLDSLQSFGALIVDDPETSEEMISLIGLTNERANQLIDAFSEGGFSDQAFAKKYRTMYSNIKREADLRYSLQRANEARSKVLHELEEDLTLLTRVEEESPLQRPGENYSAELDGIESEINATLSQLMNIPEDKLERRSTQTPIQQLRNKIQKKTRLVESTNKRMNRIENELNEFQWPLSRDVYEKTNAFLMKISLQVTPALAIFITNRHSDFEKYRQLEEHTDLTSPHEWYPHARLDKRKIIFHAGPTNSGKTYSALQRLKQAKKGMYLAPLRLLAAECYENLTSDGIYTDLITGQETRSVPFSTHRSSTVELACIDEDFDVVVIDEIQMICDSFRGFAWTRALMGVRCKEIHVCGGLEAKSIVAKIAQMCGDDFEMKTYTRFGELRVLENSLAATSTSKGSYSNVQPGDCVVAFSRNDIFAIKREIEQSTHFKCCVIYGALPPAIRAEQARRFNDPNSEYEVLVASDAIGMGLNLSIKRIIFNSLFKNNGESIVQLDHSLVKQIAGRAGRRNSPYPHGEVTTRDPFDMEHLRKCMSTEIEPIQKAGIIPTANHIGLFDELLKEYGASKKERSLHETLRKFSEMAQLRGNFFLCRQKSFANVSKWLKDVDMPSTVKFTLCMSPVNESCPRSKRVLMRYVEMYVSGKTPGVHRSMRPREATSFHNLTELCTVHHELELFLWLQSKLPTNAVEQARALAMKEDAIEKINEGLSKANKLKLSMKHDYVSKDVGVKKMWTKEMKASKYS